MSAARHDFVVEQGTDWTQPLLWKDSGDQPIDNSGYTARMQVRQQVNFDVVLVELTTENNRIVLGGADGTITLVLTEEQTRLIPADVYRNKFVYDLELVSGGGLVTRLLEGDLEVSLEVTR